MAFPVTAAAPIRSAVEFDNRISTRLNRAGTEKTNHIIGSTRDGTDTAEVAGGFSFRLRFGMTDALEQIRGASVTIYDDDGAVLSTSSITGLWTTSATTLVASADLQAGIDIPSEATPRRAIVQVWTSRKRALSGQLWIGNLPTNQVLLNGVQTTQAQPLEITVAALGVSQAFSVQLFPSLNDEVGRQHGQQNAALAANVLKPYGGATNIAVLKGFFPVFEGLAEEMTTLTHTPSADGELVQFRFLMRSAESASSIVTCYAYVRFNLCATTTGGGTTTTTEPLVCPPCVVGPIIKPPTQIPDPNIFQPEPGVVEEDTGGKFVRVRIDEIGDIGEGTDPAQVDLKLLGYGGATEEVAGSPRETIISLGAEQTESIGSPVEGMTEKVYLPSPIDDADLVVVRPETTVAGGSAIVFVKPATDVGQAMAPVVSNVSYNFETQNLTVTLASLGFPGETVTLHVKPLYGEIESGGSGAQDSTSLAIDDAAEQTENFTATGSGVGFTTTFSETPQAVMVWGSNSVGVSQQVTFERDTSQTVYAPGPKKGPTISGGSLSSLGSTNDVINIVVDDTGENVTSMVLRYRIVEAVLGAETAQMPTVEDVGRNTIAPTTGSKQSQVQSGDNDIRGRYFVWLEGEQGNSNTIAIDNLGGAGSLP